MFYAAKLTSDAALSPSGLTGVAICHGLALFVAVAISANISGGHVNPAVTFGLFVGGNITLFKGILYWIAQLLGAVVACLLLRVSTNYAVCPQFSNNMTLNMTEIWKIEAIHDLKV